MTSQAGPVYPVGRDARPFLADRPEAPVGHRNDAAETDAEAAGHLGLHRERAFELRVREEPRERAEHRHGAAGIGAAVARAAGERIREKVGDEAPPPERAVVRRVAAPVGAEEPLERGSFQDVVLVASAIETVSYTHLR